MSYADKIFVANMRDIIDNGYSDAELEVRPHWADGTPAHTVKKFCIVNRYVFTKEFPVISVRKNGVRGGYRRNFVDMAKKIEQRARS